MICGNLEKKSQYVSKLLETIKVYNDNTLCNY